jgi:hypothetical protein
VNRVTAERRRRRYDAAARERARGRHDSPGGRTMLYTILVIIAIVVLLRLLGVA